MTEPTPENKGSKAAAPRQKMPAQDPQERIKNFEEVPFGYTREQAMLEASRCIDCKHPRCIEGCPVHVPIPEFLALISKGLFLEAAKLIRTQNILPAVCGRVCPQEEQCEKLCIIGKRFKPVAIGYLERFAADFERISGQILIPDKKTSTGKKVAVIGSGPAGLAAAGDLIRWGYEVVVFEALHEPGGVLIYGIPEFRLPKAIVKTEVKYLESLGAQFRMNTVVGRSITVDELFEEEGFNAVFIGTGAGLPRFMGIPGENLVGVYSANEYLTRANLMKAYQFPKYDTPVIRGRRVATIGGGNVSMDSARTALRLGAEKSFLVYRRSREEMPAKADEVDHAEEEGLEMHFLTLPVEILGDAQGRVRALRCQKMSLGELDKSGRRRPVPIEGSEFEIEADVVIVAIGNAPNKLVPSTTPGIKTEDWGGIITDQTTGKTSKNKVFAGGDAVTGAATVILAMGAGRRAAEAIHKELSS